MPYAVMETNTEDKLVLIARRAKDNNRLKFTSLTHLLNIRYLKKCYQLLRSGRRAGVDGRTVESYSKEEMNTALEKTAKLIQSKKYKPQPVKRVYIEKENGERRPLGMPTVIDKVVQLGIARILEQIYEQTFLSVSFGYRPERNPHECLKAINHMVMGKKLNFLIDADIEGFFDHINHNWMMKCLDERISDPNFKLLIYRFLKAGAMEGGRFVPTTDGTPQGGNISPILANIYLHYVLDLWFERKIKPELKGFVQEVRYADDFVIGIQHKSEADYILDKLGDRLNKFGLQLSREKTRIIEFGRFAYENRKRRGQNKPETFDFLGLTHYCTKTRDGRFMVRVKTARKRMNRSAVSVNRWLKTVRNRLLLKDIWKMIALKLQGHYNYYGVSGNFESINRYYRKTLMLTFKWLNRRSQKKTWNMESFEKYLTTYPLPKPKLIYAFYNTW